MLANDAGGMQFFSSNLAARQNPSETEVCCLKFYEGGTVLISKKQMT